MPRANEGDPTDPRIQEYLDRIVNFVDVSYESDPGIWDVIPNNEMLEEVLSLRKADDEELKIIFHFRLEVARLIYETERQRDIDDLRRRQQLQEKQ